MNDSSHKIKGLVFDKDGTLFDFAATWEAWAVAFLLRAANGDTDRAIHVGTQIGFDFQAQKFDRDSVVIAGTPHEVAAALKPHALAHLAQAGVTRMFDFIAGFDSGHGAKPGPGQLLAFAAQTGLAPDTIAMIGDSTHDLRAGRAAGMTCVAVLTGLATHAELAPHADVVLPDIGHLPGWLDGATP